jgi:hypothetical protein
MQVKCVFGGAGAILSEARDWPTIHAYPTKILLIFRSD